MKRSKQFEKKIAVQRRKTSKKSCHFTSSFANNKTINPYF